MKFYKTKGGDRTCCKTRSLGLTVRRCCVVRACRRRWRLPALNLGWHGRVRNVDLTCASAILDMIDHPRVSRQWFDSGWIITDVLHPAMPRFAYVGHNCEQSRSITIPVGFDWRRSPGQRDPRTLPNDCDLRETKWLWKTIASPVLPTK